MHGNQFESHEISWNAFLVDLASTFEKILEPNVDSEHLTGYLECAVEFDEIKLRLPLSRVASRKGICKYVALDGFQGRLQTEYNTNPIGPYMGPYGEKGPGRSFHYEIAGAFLFSIPL